VNFHSNLGEDAAKSMPLAFLCKRGRPDGGSVDEGPSLPGGEGGAHRVYSPPPSFQPIFVPFVNALEFREATDRLERGTLGGLRGMDRFAMNVTPDA
jgi:hypothetical protein